MYPPGQFSSWNRASTRAAWLGVPGSGGASGGTEAEPGYSALAVSDPSADATATQTWAAIDGDLLSDGWTPPRIERDWGSHTGDTGPIRQRTGSRPAAPGGPAATGRPAGGRPAGPRAPGADSRAARVAGPTQPGPVQPGLTQPGNTLAGAALAGAALAGADQGGAALAGADQPDTALPGAALPGAALAGGALAGPALPGVGQPGAAPAGAGEPEPVIPRATDHRARGPVPRQAPRGPGEADPGRRSRAAASSRTVSAGRRATKPGKRHNVMMAGLLLAPVLVVVLVAAGYVYFSSKPAPTAGHAPTVHHPTLAPPSPTPTLGPWKHIESRTQDTTPLTGTELFPATFSANGATGVRTVDKASAKCSREVFGSKLAAAVRKADCTQVLRASYLSTDHKIMATIGVLNLTNVAAATHAGKVSGSSEFIKQLPAAHGPTRNLSKGTGIEEAEFKGHYLILIWTEFANLHAPSGKNQRKKLESFSAGLIAGTANVSLTRRMVTGHP